MHPRLNCDESKDQDLCVCIHVRKGDAFLFPGARGRESRCAKQRNIEVIIISFILSFSFLISILGHFLVSFFLDLTIYDLRFTIYAFLFFCFKWFY
jgi:hypothetical protein